MVRPVLLTLMAVATSLLVAATPASADPAALDPLNLTPGFLTSVTCLSESFCTAAGGAPERNIGENAPGLLDLRDTTGWHSQLVQPRDQFVEFEGVACSSASACLAVGGNLDGGPLAARWNGTRWKAVGAPATLDAFRSVSCPSSELCIAVGYTRDGGPGAATWNGRAWTATPVPPAQGGGQTILQGLSCPTPRWCMAVGRRYPTSGVATTITAVFAGGAWTVDPAPSAPAGAAQALLWSVDCRSTSFCMTTGTADALPLAEVWNGTTWRRVATPRGATGAVSTALYGVSCPRVTACTAVGSAFDPGTGAQQPVAQSWDGTTWTSTSTPPTAVGPVSALRAVSCTRPTWCLAVGSIDNPHPRREYTLAERWNGTTWTQEAT